MSNSELMVCRFVVERYGYAAGCFAPGLVPSHGAEQVPVGRDPLLPGVDAQRCHGVQVKEGHENEVLAHSFEQVGVQPNHRKDDQVEPVDPDRKLVAED